MDKKTLSLPTNIYKSASSCVLRTCRAMLVSTLILLGCGAGLVGCGESENAAEKLPEVYTDAGFSYMRDPEFRGPLDSLLGERSRLSSQRGGIKAELDLVKKECENAGVELTEEGRKLEKELARLEGEIARVQNEINTLSRNRLMRAINDGKLVEEGKAKAIVIKDFQK